MNVTGVDVILYQAEANSLEVRGVYDRSEVYKISMVRMYENTDELANERV